jgi:ABC-type nickel/cobalt efflux system permease component RcnA
MMALGLLFMIVAAAVTAGAIYDGGEDAQFEVFGQTIGTTVSGVFVAGIATMLLFFLGVYLLMKSLTRSRRKRLERKETKTRQRESVSKIEEERAQLRAENEALQEKLARDRRPDPATTSGETAAAAETMVDNRHVDNRHTDHQHTDLTAHDTPASSTSGRHRDEI